MMPNPLKNKDLVILFTFPPTSLYPPPSAPIPHPHTPNGPGPGPNWPGPMKAQWAFMGPSLSQMGTMGRNRANKLPNRYKNRVQFLKKTNMAILIDAQFISGLKYRFNQELHCQFCLMCIGDWTKSVTTISQGLCRKLIGHNLLYSTSNFALIIHMLFGPYILHTYRDYKRRILKNQMICVITAVN